MENAANTPRKTLPMWLRGVVYLVFFITVNLLAGYIAVRFDYPSLFNVDTNFVEYALPLPFTWALSHLPSTLLSISLLMCIRIWQEKQLKIFRISCLVIFALLFLELDAKSPFFLFGKIDSLCAFLFSLVLAPPSKEANPFLVKFLIASAGVILLSIAGVLFSRWQHRVPALVTTTYIEGVFELTNIVVFSNFRKTLEFHIVLTAELSEEDVCMAGQDLANGLLNDYPFDNAYNKVVFLSYAQADGSIDIGEISLNDEDREGSDLYPCYVKMGF